MHSHSMKKYRDIYVAVNGVTLTGLIQIPETISGVVIFAHGMSSSRFSPVNRQVADKLNESGLATVLIDLLTPGERALAKQRTPQSNIQLIASRLIRIIGWIKRDEALQELPLGIFATSISAAAALSSAIERTDAVTALVLSDARPASIRDVLPQVKAPTLLIAGDKDRAQAQWSPEAEQTLEKHHRLEFISGTTHEPQNHTALEQIGAHAAHWFTEKFAPTKS